MNIFEHRHKNKCVFVSQPQSPVYSLNWQFQPTTLQLQIAQNLDMMTPTLLLPYNEADRHNEWISSSFVWWHIGSARQLV